MRWILLDVGIGLLAVLLLAAIALQVWRRGRAFSRELSRAAEVVGGASTALAQLKAPSTPTT